MMPRSLQVQWRLGFQRHVRRAAQPRPPALRFSIPRRLQRLLRHHPRRRPSSAQQAVGEMSIPTPQIGIGPDLDNVAVQLWTWLWVDDPCPLTMTAAAGTFS